MTNLQFNVNWLLKEMKGHVCFDSIFRNRFYMAFGIPIWQDEDFYKWCKEEHKYKLTKCEYDMLKTNDQSHNRKLSSFSTYLNMRKAGWFKDINFELTINEVLKDAIVVDACYSE